MTPEKQLIVFITAADPAQGAPHQAMAAIWLRHLGYRMLCVCCGPASRKEIATPLATLDVISIQRSHSRWAAFFWQFNLLIALLALRAKHKNCLFYVHGSVVTPASLLALLLVPAHRIIYHTQDYLEPGRHNIWAFFEKRFARRACKVFCNEPNRARFMASNYRLKEIPTAVRTALPGNWPVADFMNSRREELLARFPAASPPERLIMHQGPFAKVRCSEQLIEVMALLPENYRLIVTGVDTSSTEYAAWHDIVLSFGLEGKIDYLPHLSFEILLSYTSVCNMGLLLYPNDGVGNYFQAPGRLTEYMRCGLPVVTSNFPGLELLTLKYDIGIACDPGSPAEIAAAILRLGSRSNSEMARERTRLKELATTEFAYENQAWQIEDIINKMQEGLHL